MFREATRDEIKQVAAPLWLLVNHALAPADFARFNIIRSGACSIVSHLAYCAVGADEREKKNRAKVVPSTVFQKLVDTEDFDLAEVLDSRADFQNVEIVRTRSFVAVIIPARDIFLIGIRGTQFAYDWLINLNARKAIDRSGERFHKGFLREACELAKRLDERICAKYTAHVHGYRGNCSIWLTGHSLGGAIAAIVNHIQLQLPIDACYIFGAPRVAVRQAFSCRYQPFATRRRFDIVPHCPPKAFGYSDFLHELNPTGTVYLPTGNAEMYVFLSWLMRLATHQYASNHAMERYRFEVIEAAKKHPRNERYWRPEFDFQIC